MKLVKLGTVALDGTKIHTNASRHSALSYGHADKLEAQLLAEVKELLAHAESADTEALPEGLDIPKELARREARLQAITQAKAEIEARAAQHLSAEQAEYEAKMKAREEKVKTPLLKTQAGSNKPATSCCSAPVVWANHIWPAPSAMRSLNGAYRCARSASPRLVQQLQQARHALTLPEALAKLDRYRLLIIDDLA